MKELLKQEVKNQHRNEVVQLLKDGAFEQITEAEMRQICKELVALRDERVIEILAKRVKFFEPEILELDLKNWNNREFVSFVLNKYQKKFDWQDENVCEKMFEIACETDNKKTARYLVQQRKATCMYPKLASSSDLLFDLIYKINFEELDNNQIVEFIVLAALSGKAVERLRILKDKGIALDTKNTKGETAQQILEARIHVGKYDKNKSGNLKKQRDKAALQYLRKLENGLIEEEKKPITLEKILPIATAGVILLCVITGVAIHQFSKSNEAEETADGTADYNTDTSLVVADGDTVNIDYVGSIDGEEFEGGNTNGAGTSLTIGSGSYIDDFEEQLIGHNVGETFTISVTFPEDYGKDELNGKEAQFEVTINGIYEE